MKTSVRKPLLVNVTDYSWGEFEWLRENFDVRGVGHLEGDPDVLVARIGEVRITTREETI